MMGDVGAAVSGVLVVLGDDLGPVQGHGRWQAP
ncbi:hypothetical protein QO004_002004 [Rhizobium mesoamericanum]|nr:hypothetical protein [Rhizobium mesoamericanum]